MLVESEGVFESVPPRSPATVPPTELTTPAAPLVAGTERTAPAESPLATASLHHALAEHFPHLLILIGNLRSG